jgi:hypothetical protein
MAITWGEFRTQIRRSILRDDDTKQKWSNDLLRDCVGFALDAFCAHTAQATATSYTPADGTDAFTLPDNVYASLEDSALVFIEGATSQPQYLLPVFLTPGVSTKTVGGFYVWPRQALNLTQPLSNGEVLKVFYYAYYNHPVADSDLIDLPSWGYTAVAYLTASYALSNRASQEAMLSQYDTKKDSGTPDTLAVKTIQEWYLKTYETELSRHPRQQRVGPNRGKK